MLQQILTDMFIEPDLLLELSDEQKQILFLKMREEQVRRWREYEDKLDKEERRKPKPKPKPGKKGVSFLKGSDGNEWVWVMGEHPSDKSIEQILEEEAQAKALLEAEREAEELREKEEAETQRKLEEERKRMQEEIEREKRRQEEAALYQSIKEARLMAKKAEEERKRLEEEEKRKMQEIATVERRKTLQHVDNMKKRRSDELYIKWKEMKRNLDKVAEESSKELEKNFREQERRSKVAEEEMRDIARRAREENRLSLDRVGKLIINANRMTMGEKPPLPPKTSAVIDKHKQAIAQRKINRGPRPPNREAVVEWFHEEEKSKRTVIDKNTGKIAEWFHGVITRMDAEKLLIDKPKGSYLVRVSEKVWGYTISYRAVDRCKHFLIDASEDQYHFFGPNQLPHDSIVDLVNHHKKNPITVIGGEVLLSPSAQICDPPDYWELFQNRRTESTAL